MQTVGNCSQSKIKKAARALKNGHLVAFPTETVYGLGADATNQEAVGKIYSVKGRPLDHPVIVHISSIDGLKKWSCKIPDYALNLASKFWPGPMTLILPRTKLAGDFITGGQNYVGIRIPAHPVALALLKEFEDIGGKGVAAPSANKFGAVSPTTAEEVIEEIGSLLSIDDLVLDGGFSELGIESTIISCASSIPRILRPGHVTFEMVADTLNMRKFSRFKLSNLRVSGNLNSHYAPICEVILDKLASPGEGFIAMSNVKTPIGAIRLASPNTVHEFAQNIYSALRLGDKRKLQKIAIILPTGSGVAIAIRDRLTKAANSNK